MATTAHHRGSLPFMHRSSSISRPDVADGLFSPQSTKFMTKLRVRKQSNARDTITPTEAVWFLSLPDKVKRQHFTKEEQILTRAISELALLDASPETLTQVEHPRSHLRTKSMAYEGSTGTATASVSASASPCPSPNLAKFPSINHRHSVAPESLRSRPAQWHASPSNPMQPEKSARVSLQPQLLPPQQTFLRSPTIISGTWDRNTAISPSLDTLRPSTGRSLSQTSQRAGPPPPLTIQKPLYYKDPTTQSILKDSKGRFEETLMFGFPQMDPNYLRPPPSAYDVVSPGTQIKETWLDSSMFADGDDQDDEHDLSSADEIEPPTPDSFMQPQVVRNKSNYFLADQEDDDDDDDDDDDQDPYITTVPAVPRAGSNTSYFEELMSRDMTLRMTLTKPELRATENELYGWQDDAEEDMEPILLDKDPLALADLTFSDDVTGSNGAFAQALAKKKGIKAFWFRK